jgi:AcrR family transcriptional regulator
MPKAFTKPQKEMIEAQLIQATMARLNRLDEEKLTVDQLVRDVGISKGAFYLFFDSKEALIFRTIVSFHDLVEAEMQELIMKSGTKDQKALFIDIMNALYASVQQAPWLLKLEGAMYQDLVKKIDQNALDAHLEKDQEMTQRMMELFGIADRDAPLVSAHLRAIFMLLLHKKEIGEAYFDIVVSQQISWLADGLFGRAS